MVRRLGGTLLLAIALTLAGCSTQSTALDTSTPSTTPATQDEAPAPSFTSEPTTLADTSDIGQEVTDAGVVIVENWWFPESDTTYSELAATLEIGQQITPALADSWRSRGDETVPNISEIVQITSMETTRLEPDNATFEIVFEQRANLGEPQLTFIEFLLDETGQWKADQIR